MQPVTRLVPALSLEAGSGDATGHPLLFKKIAHLQEPEFLFLLTAIPSFAFSQITCCSVTFGNGRWRTDYTGKEAGR